jgi:hypothetical protein
MRFMTLTRPDRAGKRACCAFAGRMARYRAVKPFPEILEYRNARLVLERFKSADWSIENLAYFKEENRGSFIVLVRGDGLFPVEKQLAEGFEVIHRPHLAIMESLVAKGYAQRID